MHKNFKGIEKTVFGRGSFSQLAEIAEAQRGENDHFMLYLVDQYFKDKALEKRIQAGPNDVITFIDVDPEEPTTTQIDAMIHVGVPVIETTDAIFGKTIHHLLCGFYVRQKKIQKSGRVSGRIRNFRSNWYRGWKHYGYCQGSFIDVYQ